MLVPLQAQNPNTAAFPGAVATDQTLTVAKDLASSTLSAAVTSTSTLSFTVTNGAVFANYNVLVIDSEQILVCSISGATITVCNGGRGFGGSTAATHANNAVVRNLIVAYGINQASAEIKAIETALGANLSHVANDAANFTAGAFTYNFSGATATRPLKTGTATPGTCTVGDMFFETDAVAGSNLWLCTATNTWSQVSVSGSLDGDLEAIANLTGTNIIPMRTGTNTWSAVPATDAATGSTIPIRTVDGDITFRYLNAIRLLVGDGTVAGQWAGSELAVNGTDIRGFGVPDAIDTANSHINMLSNSAPSSGQVMRWASIAGGKSQGSYADAGGVGGCATGTFEIADNNNGAPDCDQVSFIQLIGYAALAQGGTGIENYVPTNDGILVGVSGALVEKLWTNCTAANEAITYNTTTHAIGCHTISSAGVPWVGSGAIDFPSIPVGSYADGTFPATGAATGDAIRVGLPSGIGNGVSCVMWVSAADTVTTRCVNNGTVAINMGSLQFSASKSSTLTGSGSLNYGSIPVGYYEDLTITVAGAVVGDQVALGIPTGIGAGIFPVAWVSAADTVTIRCTNYGTGPINMGALTFSASVPR